MNTREEIEKYAAEVDKPVLLWLLSNYHWQSQWDFVAKCTHERHGHFSYQTHRVWKPTKEGYILYAVCCNGLVMTEENGHLCFYLIPIT